MVTKQNCATFMFSGYYKNKRILLTGHTGFKGSWMLKWLQLLGANVMGYALEPTQKKCLYNLIEGDKLCHSIIGDICNEEKLGIAIYSFQPEIIFHFAAQPLVRYAYTHPIETFKTNAVGTACLLNTARTLKNGCTIINVTTDKVYDNKEWIYPYRETDALGGYDPYSSSKACSEIITASFISSFFSLSNYANHKISVATCRAGNVIGGGDWSDDRIIPDMITSLNSKKTIPIRNPNAVRPWQHVVEPLSGYLLLAMQLSLNPQVFSGAWNFGPDSHDNVTVKEIVDYAIKFWGSGDYSIQANQDQPHEANQLKLDISKAVSLLKWSPKWSAQEAVKKTIEWYKVFNTSPTEAVNLINKTILDYFLP